MFMEQESPELGAIVGQPIVPPASLPSPASSPFQFRRNLRSGRSAGPAGASDAGRAALPDAPPCGRPSAARGAPAFVVPPLPALDPPLPVEPPPVPL